MNPATSSPPQPTGHPPGLYLLFTVEMWERFSFYGMKAFLFLFMTATIAAGGLGWSDQFGGQMMGTYSGLVFLSPIIGGYIADRYLGMHRALVIGGWTIAAGHFILALETLPTFFLGLLFVIAGTGLFKSNVSTMVGRLYGEKDDRRDRAFTIFYMGINLGAFAAPLVCGFLRTQYGWRYGFAAAGVGMAVGQIIYVLLRPRYLAGIGLPPARRTAADGAGPGQALTPDERSRVLAIFVVTFLALFFWGASEQATTSLTSFAARQTDRSVPPVLEGLLPAPVEDAGTSTSAPAQKLIPVDWFQSINPLCIILFGPLVALLWRYLSRKNIEPGAVVKMGCGMLVAAGGFVVMIFAAQLSEPAPGGPIRLVGPMWLTATYFLTTLGELALSPVGLSLVSKVAPARFAAALMGVWFLSNSLAYYVAGVLGGLVKQIAAHGFILKGQAGFFLLFVIFPGAAGVATLLLAPRLQRIMRARA